MNIEAQLLAGMPPYGRGVFARAAVPVGPYRWCAVVAGANAARDVAAARALGYEVWLYLGYDAFTSDTWSRSLALIVQHARENGVIRIIVDPESMAHDRAAMTALGLALAPLLSDFIIAITSIPTAGNLDALLAPLGDRVSGIVQIYGRTSQRSADFASWLARWRSYFGERTIFALAGWNAGPLQKDAASYAVYLAALPHACGCAVWYEGNAPLSYATAQLASYEPGGSAPGTLALACAAFFARTAGAAVTAAVGVVLLLAVGLATHGGLAA